MSCKFYAASNLVLLHHSKCYRVRSPSCQGITVDAATLSQLRKNGQTEGCSGQTDGPEVVSKQIMAGADCPATRVCNARRRDARPQDMMPLAEVLRRGMACVSANDENCPRWAFFNAR